MINGGPVWHVPEQEIPPEYWISNQVPPVATGGSQSADIRRRQEGHDEELQVHLKGGQDISITIVSIAWSP